MEHVWIVAHGDKYDGTNEQFVCGTEELAGAKASELREEPIFCGEKEWKVVGENQWERNNEYITIEKTPVIWALGIAK